MNVDTKVHLAHIQAFFYKLESLAGENIILLESYCGTITEPGLPVLSVCRFMSVELSLN